MTVAARVAGFVLAALIGFVAVVFAPWVFAVALLLGLVPATIASVKGRSFLDWWVYGAVLWPLALSHAIVVPKDWWAIERRQAAEGLRKCPSCAEMIKPDAVVCRYCGRSVPPIEETRSCPDCHAEVPVDQPACPECGAPQA